jgi:hypothetical protein
MAVLRWQWKLANGAAVDAVIDDETATETVSQGSHLLSQSPRGAKPDGHVVLAAPDRPTGASHRPAIEATVTFAPDTPICILRVDGYEVAPNVWPVRVRAPRPVPPEPVTGRYVLIALAVLALVGVGLAVRTLRADSARSASGELDGTHRSANGLFIAHFPKDLAPRIAVLPGGMGGVVLEDRVKSTTLVIAALGSDAMAARDPWALQQSLAEEALANLPKGAARYEETARREDTCYGHPGAVVLGRLVRDGQRQARIWSCAFFHDRSGYLFLSMLAEPSSTADEQRVRAIFDATELTKLAELGTSESPR